MNAVISIITICRNDMSGLKKTIQSITYTKRIEHIIVDGNSNDGTKDYLESLNTAQSSWTSEKDNGIYDAMNKGLSAATGDYVIFMNSGDRFHTIDTIPLILEILMRTRPDILYGDAMYVDDQGEHLGLRSNITTRKLPKTLSWKDMKRGMLVCHQSFIVRRTLAPNYILNNLSADIDWQIKCLKSAIIIRLFEDPICQYLIGGTSQVHHLKSLIDRFKVLTIHFGLVKTLWYHILIFIRAFRFRLSSQSHY